MTDWTKDPETWRTWRELPGRTAVAVVCRMPATVAGVLRYAWQVTDRAAIVARGETPWFDEAKDRAAAALEALS